MKKTTLLFLIMLALKIIQAQNYQITFAGSGASSTVDSVLVENLTQGTHLKLLGLDTLILSGHTYVNRIQLNNEDLFVYPNPSQGQAYIAFYAKQTGVVKLSIFDLSGKIIVENDEFISQGTVNYELTGLKQGNYFINIIGDNYIYQTNLISLNSCNNKPIINRAVNNTSEKENYFPMKLMVGMPYMSGDILRFTGYSGYLSAIVNDIPTSSKTITFVFIGLLPTITTAPISSITVTAATSGGDITSDGGSPVTARGICYSTSPAPTIADNSIAVGTGTGVFTADMIGLTQNTTYYVRAYATNSVGTAYGNEISFTTNIFENCGGSVSFNYLGTNVNYGTVNGKFSLCWLDRNLGAAAPANSFNDANGYGDLFQWGRLVDGHQLRTSGVTSLLSITDIPGHSFFITTHSDWRDPQNDNLWQGVLGINNPCPLGWRIPTITELNNESGTWVPQNYIGAIASILRWTAAGNRNYGGGVLSDIGVSGSYWSSTIVGTYVRNLSFTSSLVGWVGNMRANGLSVRCIRDY